MSVEKEIKQGVFHTTIYRYAGYIVNFIISIFLARLLTPEEFGVVAVINVIVLFFLMLGAFGIGEAIVQNQDLSDRDIYSLFVISIFIGLVFSIVFFSMSGFVAGFYGNREYVKITRLLSIALFFQTASTVPYHLLRKYQKFKTLGVITFGSGILTGISAIIMAFYGFSYYALVYKSILDAFLSFVLCLLLIKLKLFKTISTDAFIKFFKYSLFQSLYNFISYISRNTDIIVIGKYLGTLSIGYYERGTRLFTTITGLSQVISPVLHPVLSNRQNEKELLYSVLIKLTSLLSVLFIPLSIFLFFTSSEIIVLLYGHQWINTIPAFKYMALQICIYLLITTNVSFFQALGKTNLLFFYGTMYFFVLITAVMIGVFVNRSFVQVALYILISNLILLIISYYLLVKKVFDKNLFNFLQIFRSGVIIGISIWIVNQLSMFILKDYNLIISLVVKTIISAITYMILLNYLKEYKKIISLVRT